jgi:hypothetical protein
MTLVQLTNILVSQTLDVSRLGCLRTVRLHTERSHPRTRDKNEREAAPSVGPNSTSSPNHGYSSHVINGSGESVS